MKVNLCTSFQPCSRLSRPSEKQVLLWMAVGAELLVSVDLHGGKLEPVISSKVSKACAKVNIMFIWNAEDFNSDLIEFNVFVTIRAGRSWMITGRRRLVASCWCRWKMHRGCIVWSSRS